ncbi:MAG TPA: hypothetical protein VHQ24_00385 [Lachnospiraceae bacterium]|nr:hypothetical protein [Lachnospiraceae bacterium]
MKKIIVLTLCVVMSLTVIACSSKSPQKEKEVASEETTQIPNPFEDFDTIDEAEKSAGFEISDIKSIPDTYRLTAIRAVENDLIEIIYKDGENEIRIRKAKGNEDISGDYNEYKDSNTVEINNASVTMKGNDGKVSVATWVDGDYSYSITANVGKEGIDSNQIVDIIESIK